MYFFPIHLFFKSALQLTLHSSSSYTSLLQTSNLFRYLISFLPQTLSQCNMHFFQRNLSISLLSFLLSCYFLLSTLRVGFIILTSHSPNLRLWPTPQTLSKQQRRPLTVDYSDAPYSNSYLKSNHKSLNKTKKESRSAPRTILLSCTLQS